MIQEDIISLLTEYLSGEISPEHKQKLQRWIGQDKANKAFFEKFVRECSLPERWQIRENISVDAAIRLFDQRTERKTFVSGLRRFGWYAAAILVLGFGVALFYSRQPSQPVAGMLRDEITCGYAKAILILDSGEKLQLTEADSLYRNLDGGNQIVATNNRLVYQGKNNVRLQCNELQIPRGGEFQVVLEDGTVVYLNSASSLKYPVVFGKDKREVELTGEGYFEVAKSEVPFLVHTGNQTLCVYGTSFNINSHIPGRIQTALVEGKVGITVKNAPGEYMLIASQLADFNTETGRVTVKQTDLSPYIAWTKGLFVFTNETLKQIMSTLALWYDMEFVFRNPALEELHFTGCVKRYDRIDQILKGLSQSVGVKFQKQGKTLFISN